MEEGKDKPFNRKSVFHSGTKRLQRLLGRPCPHCQLIDSGDVAMYQVTCPECGEIPPSRRHLYPNISTTDVCTHFINAQIIFSDLETPILTSELVA